MKNRIVVGLDIGTTKIAALIAEVGGKEIKIKGVGTCPSVGLRRGMVVNIEHTVESIKKAMQQAELMAGIQAESVYVGIAGDHVRGINSHAVVAVGRDDREITEDDVRRVIDAAKAINMPMDREIIHVIPQEFIVDKQEGIQNPIGLTGTRLEVEAHVVTGAVASAQNIYRCVERAGYKVKDLVLEPLASSYAVLETDEQELGVVLIDIGGGTTDIAMFFDGSIRNTDMLGIAGQAVTNDVSICLKIPYDKAEEIKKKHGCAMASLVDETESILIPGVGGRDARRENRQFLSKVIEARMMEIFNLVRSVIEKSKLRSMMNAGVVLTGGGSLLEGSAELATEIFQLPVRIGSPRGFGGLMDAANSPIYATGIGLIHYGIQKEKSGDDDMEDEGDETPPEGPTEGDPGETHTDALEMQSQTGEYQAPLYQKISKKMKRWTEEFF
ncbi:cell division protein FtsA [bacterium]|nr:cell division protein FtsA [bacterium]NUN45727.1 cell division protein FtsA [bacterium]HMV25411.1 cell division protein FtsA [bacterium]HMW34116.1 cell division protein FtsA [bacterium]HMW36752.1 cell division protein FtsA [bacterium]